MPSPRAAWQSTRDSFLNSGISAAIRFIWRVATPRPTLTATHEPFSALALDRVVSAWGLPRRQSWNGLAFCCRSGNAEEECLCGMAIPRADCCRTFCSDRTRSGRSRDCRRSSALGLRQDSRRLRSSCLWTSPATTEKPSTLGRNANRFSRFVHLVLPHGLCSRCRLHAAAHLAKDVSAPRGGWRRFFSPPPRAWLCRAVVCRAVGCRIMDRVHRLAGPYARIPSRHGADRLRGL